MHTLDRLLFVSHHKSHLKCSSLPICAYRWEPWIVIWTSRRRTSVELWCNILILMVSSLGIAYLTIIIIYHISRISYFHYPSVYYYIHYHQHGHHLSIYSFIYAISSFITYLDSFIVLSCIHLSIYSGTTRDWSSFTSLAHSHGTMVSHASVSHESSYLNDIHSHAKTTRCLMCVSLQLSYYESSIRHVTSIYRWWAALICLHPSC